MYTNTDKLTAVIVHWAKPMVDQVMASVIGKNEGVVAANEWVKKYFPVGSNYSIVNDLSFLAVPASQMVIEPVVRNAVAKLGVKDADVPAYAKQLVDSMLDEAEKKGSVTLFETVELEKSDIERLRSLLDKNLAADETEKYQVIE